jgi:hypothetical protein
MGDQVIKKGHIPCITYILQCNLGIRNIQRQTSSTAFCSSIPLFIGHSGAGLHRSTYSLQQKQSTSRRANC